MGATLPERIPFMGYWPALSAKLTGGADLTGQVGMDRLNRLRNGFKHAGTLPGLAAIEQARGDVTSFMEDNTLAVFGIPFSGIDMADVISHDDTRRSVKAAVATAADGNRREAMGQLAEILRVIQALMMLCEVYLTLRVPPQ